MYILWRTIDVDFIGDFITGVKLHGLQNHVVTNVMDIRIHKQDIIMDLVIREAKSTSYNNHVCWKEEAKNFTCILYNGNHRFHYMKTQLDYVDALQHLKRS